MITDDLAIIKKQYGEKMMHLCRSMFSTILEKPGLLSNLLLEHFDSSRSLYEDIVENYLEKEFKNYIYDFIKCPIKLDSIKNIIFYPELLLTEYK